MMSSTSSTKRNIQTVIAAIIVAVPNPAPPEFADNLTTLVAELRLISRAASYWPPEVEAQLWARLGTTCYRYLPPPTAATWAQVISDIVLGVIVLGVSQ